MDVRGQTTITLQPQNARNIISNVPIMFEFFRSQEDNIAASFRHL
jgi:hypothetical protein